MVMRNVLIIEDDADIAGLLDIHLSDMNCSCEKVQSGAEGFIKARSGLFDLIILDLMLPEMDGVEVCTRLRALDINTPILMLTAKAEEIDKVLGLECGADDYLTKPFSIRELTARVKAILRRVKMISMDSTESIRFKELTIDLSMHKVTINGNRIDLTPKEFSLLTLLATHPGRNYSREELLRQIWGYEFSGYEHTVNSHVNRLRSKIEPEYEKPTYILTTWGIGYRFNDELT